MFINNLIVGAHLENILTHADKMIRRSINSTKYIQPVRAKANRYYRLQGLNIDEIDADGQNVPMILHNMSQKEKNEFRKWTAKVFSMYFMTKEEGGHVSLIVHDIVTGEQNNLTDTGYGYSQVLPIVLMLWKIKNTERLMRKQTKPIILLIEQPELHLHPALQAKLIDVFAEVVNECKEEFIDLRIVFETHSETMINRLGYLISKEHLDIKSVSILAFNKSSTCIYSST